ncbi:hypothetical protein OH802_11475 [Nocardioides sp. NBC_00850]|uniref:sunset domain-containing protein n=1 Tax=Nocardioides sp. NBC_00850 TaxID=2976001 RepID=UPI00386B80AA|nr:hypothetical protein OH802_11475 [Nocardioides sp. NBC_00850]
MKWLLLLALILVLVLLIWFFFGRPIRKDAKAAHRADKDHPATEGASAPVAAATVPAEASAAEPAAEAPAADAPAAEEPAAEEPAEAAVEAEVAETATDDVTDADTAAVVAEAESVTAAAAADAETTEAEPAAAEAVTPEPAPVEAEPEAAPAAEAPAATNGAPYAGAVLPAADGSSSDAAYSIKGSSGKKYHTTASPYYGRTKAAVYFNSEESAEAAGFVRASSDFYDRSKKADTAETEQPLPPASSYGAGSADPLEDGSSPHPAYVVKGNIRKDGAKRYHTSASTAFKRTQAEVWFDSEASAEAAGFVVGFKKKANA